LNEPYFFKLENTDKPDKATAAPFKSIFIHEYSMAMQYFKNKTPVDSHVFKITPHGIFVNVIGNKIQAKIPISKKMENKGAETDVKIGDTIKIIITYLGSSRIVVEKL